MRSKAKFERVSAYAECVLPMPVRKTAKSAGYDICAVEDIVVQSHYVNIIKMILARATNQEFIQSLEEIVMNDESILVAAMEKDAEKLTELCVQYLPQIMNHFNLDLDSMKSLVKETGTKLTLVPTGVKCKLEDDQVLELFIRSSCPLNNYLLLANSTGIIDADYYNNEDNEGHIFFQIINLSPFPITIKKGDVIGQGLITRFETTEDDSAEGDRTGGFGSTDK